MNSTENLAYSNKLWQRGIIFKNFDWRCALYQLQYQQFWLLIYPSLKVFVIVTYLLHSFVCALTWVLDSTFQNVAKCFWRNCTPLFAKCFSISWINSRLCTQYWWSIEIIGFAWFLLLVISSSVEKKDWCLHSFNNSMFSSIGLNLVDVAKNGVFMYCNTKFYKLEVLL